MLSLDQAGALLRNSNFFSTASDFTIRELARRAELVRLPAGDTLFNKGDLGSALYVVVAGRVRVHNGDVVIACLGPREVFGEIAALSSESRTASVTAEIESSLLRLEHEAIYSVVASRTDAAQSIIEALCRRESQIIDEKFERVLRARVLERELDIGQKIQKSFLPAITPDFPGWQVNGMLAPARQVAGDFFDYFFIPRLQCVGIVIGDVCDKGVGAALFMTLFRSLIRSGALYGDAAGTLSAADASLNTLRNTIRSTNQYVACTHADSSMFASVFFGLLDPGTGQLSYINAGHEPLLVAGVSGIRTALPCTGPVIGLFDQAEYAIGAATVQAGELLFGYTDGVTDAQNETGEPFSEARMLATLDRAVRTGADALNEVRAAIDAFVGGADRYDDITMISVYREPA